MMIPTDLGRIEFPVRLHTSHPPSLQACLFNMLLSLCLSSLLVVVAVVAVVVVVVVVVVAVAVVVVV